MKKIMVKIKRTGSGNSTYYQEFEYTGNLNIPVTSLLENINSQNEIKDTSNNMVSSIGYSCSCLQGLCGSCAMVINDMPRLGCKTFIKDVLIDNTLKIEPLSKFPIIKDLKVDRSLLYESVKEMQLWLESNAKINKDNIQFEYEMSECLMCGCCMEACPNYESSEKYIGMPAVVSSAKLINQEQDTTHTQYMKKYYKKHFYPNCVKSLLCQDVCPMNIPTQRAISKMNRNSVWWFWQALSKYF